MPKRRSAARGAGPAPAAGRPFWKGHLTFGLVQMPVGLHPAETREELSFDLLDRRDHAPIGYLKVNKDTGEPVPKEEIVRAYEVEPGRWVTVDDADFERAAPEATRTIDVVAFVDRAELLPAYFERPYFLVPQQGGEKAYRLLAEALAEGDRVGVASIVLRTRESVAALYPMGSALVLNLMRYAHELRPPAELGLTDRVKVTEKELTMAKRLIADMSDEWKPEEFRDEYRLQLLALIRRKAAGEPEPAPPKARPAATGGKVVDLVALLEKSLGERRRGERAAPPARARARGAGSRRDSSRADGPRSSRRSA